MGRKISELYEHELIEMAENSALNDQIRREWFSRWGLEFPMIRTAFGVKKYGDVYFKTNERKNNEYITL